MGKTSEAAILALARQQGGVVGRSQILAAGMSDRMISRRLTTGRWERRYPGVYVIGGAPPSWSQDLWAAYLAVGRGVVSHETGLVARGIEARLVPRYPLTFTVRHGDHHSIPGTVVHQIDDVRPHHVGLVDGLPVSTPARAIVDLAAVVGRRRLSDLVDVVTDGKTSIACISACAGELARPGKRGIATLGAVLDERGPGYVPPQSELERRLFGALAAAGLPLPARQFPLPGRGAVAGLVDAAYCDVRLILEADGRRWHTRVQDLRRDHLRDAEAARVGWQTLRFVYEEIVGDPDHVARTVADVRRVRSGLMAEPKQPDGENR
jgi:hypothetical protein